MSTDSLVEEALAGSPQALARLISLVEDGDPEGQAVLRALHPRAGRADLIGVTGPPGVGKSTLVDAWTASLRRGGKTVGIVAVDPSSPFTGGALLGDGAGDTVVIVLVPGLGDAVQAMKAGIMEIGEAFVVNKADHGDADRTVAEITMLLQLNPDRGDWRPPVVKTVATSAQGTDDALAAIEAHRRFLVANGLLERRRRDRRRAEILRVVESKARDRALDLIRRGGRLDELAERVYRGELDPSTAADKLLTESAQSPQSAQSPPSDANRQS